MPTGTIKRMTRDRGFGFLRFGTKDYFFHRSSCVEPSYDDLNEGDEVQFEVNDKSAKGPRAENIMRLE